jgi:hypothetical protein
MAIICITTYPAVAHTASLASFATPSSEVTLAQQKSRQQLIDRHHQLGRELELNIQELRNCHNRCIPKGLCLKAKYAPPA